MINKRTNNIYGLNFKDSALYILILCILCFFLYQYKPSLSAQFFLHTGKDFKLHQLLTYPFFHQNRLHLFSNIFLFIALYKHGRKFWKKSLLNTYLLLGVFLGGISFIYFNENNNYLIGLSSIVLALATLLSITHSQSKLSILKFKIPFYYLTILIVLFHILAYYLDTNLSWSAHLGTIIGVIFWYIIFKRISYVR